MQRVLIIGSPGAGKSTLALRLAARTGLPLVHLDGLYWEPGWVRAEREVWLRRLQEALDGERWILDGNYPSTLAQQARRADTVLVLLPPRVLCLWRVIRRELSGRHPHLSGLRRGWPKWSFLRYTWHFPREAEELFRLLNAFANLRVVHLRSDTEVRDFLKTLD